MLIQPKIRGFICTTAHPEGCAAHVRQQIEFVKSRPRLPHPPKNVLVIGASTGYGLASRIVPAFGGGARTIGVFFEKPGGALAVLRFENEYRDTEFQKAFFQCRV
jgi:enoyl-[acyl-carrier protein] reductase/trans-2-enoyl-CoA reductase (NAD+)